MFVDISLSDVLMTRGQVSQLFSVSISTVRRWEKRGILPRPIRIGRAVRWKSEIIKGLLDELAGEED